MKEIIEGMLSGVTVLKEKIAGVSIFASSSESGDVQQEYDEKHYFVVPYKLSDYGFSLHTQRCLPPDVPDINNLPKRRIFHFADDHAEFLLNHYLTENAKQVAGDQSENSSLESLADGIDSLDKKMTYGMLLAGGALALINPVAGGGLALKALMPSVTGMINKKLIRPAGEKLTAYNKAQKQLEAAEHIQKQFSDADTLKVINPYLQELQLALKTTESEHDPVTGFNLADGSLPEIEHNRWQRLTETAICDVYREAYNNPRMHSKASLGPEDIRWLKTLYTVREHDNG